MEDVIKMEKDPERINRLWLTVYWPEYLEKGQRLHVLHIFAQNTTRPCVFVHTTVF